MDDDKRLVEASDGRDWLWVKLSLALVGRAMLSESSSSASLTYHLL